MVPIWLLVLWLIVAGIVAAVVDPVVALVLMVPVLGPACGHVLVWLRTSSPVGPTSGWLYWWGLAGQSSHRHGAGYLRSQNWSRLAASMLSGAAAGVLLLGLKRNNALTALLGFDPQEVALWASLGAAVAGGLFYVLRGSAR